ncbi:MAG: glycosyltransferase family 39 protein [Flavobacteriales bacterium]
MAKGRSVNAATGAGEKSRRRSSVPRGAGFVPDLKDLFQRYNKRTSGAHKRLVVFLVMAGAALRAWMLFQPITADEAFTWLHYGVRPVLDIIGDMKHPQNQVLHTLLVKLSATMFGLDAITIRLPAFLASVLSMPLFYLYVRSMFNRYIAVITLAMVAGSASLIEYGSVANGHAIVWFCMVLALVLGRHFTKENNPVSAVGMGFMLALGMWASPDGLYPALMVLLWSLFHLIFNHSDSLPARLQFWFAGFVVFLVATLLLYAPIINNHGLLQLFLHDSFPDLSWKRFKLVHTEGTMALWFHIVDASAQWFALLGLLGLIAAAYISQKYRILALAMLIGAAVPVLLMRYVPEPGTWSYTLYMLHVSTAIALFYILKLVQEKFFPKLGKRTRVAVASVVLLVATAWPAMAFLLATDRLLRFPEAAVMASYLDGALDPEDRVHADLPWEDPLLFHLMSLGWSKEVGRGMGPVGSHLFVVMDPGEEQTLASVLAVQAVPEQRLIGQELVLEQDRVKIIVGVVGPSLTAE